MHSTGTTTCYVSQDTLILNDMYLFKRGGLAEVPAEISHADTEAWGPDAMAFDSYRFQEHGWWIERGWLQGERQ